MRLILGIEYSFLSGVYSPSIGFTLQFEDSKRLVGLSGIFIGVGEVMGEHINEKRFYDFLFSR